MCLTYAKCSSQACNDPDQACFTLPRALAIQDVPLVVAGLHGHALWLTCYEMWARQAGKDVRPTAGAVYNVVDNNPASRAEVMAYAKELLEGQAAPQYSGNQQPSAGR